MYDLNTVILYGNDGDNNLMLAFLSIVDHAASMIISGDCSGYGRRVSSYACKQLNRTQSPTICPHFNFGSFKRSEALLHPFDINL